RVLGGVLQPRLLLALDEAVNFARIPRLAGYASSAPGQGIQLLLCYHDLAQLEARTGRKARARSGTTADPACCCQGRAISRPWNSSAAPSAKRHASIDPNTQAAGVRARANNASGDRWQPWTSSAGRTERCSSTRTRRPPSSSCGAGTRSPPGDD